MQKDMTFTKFNLAIAQICHHTAHQVNKEVLTEVIAKLQSICDDSLESTLLIAKVKHMAQYMEKLENQSAKIQYAVKQIETDMNQSFEIQKDYTK